MKTFFLKPSVPSKRTSVARSRLASRTCWNAGDAIVPRTSAKSFANTGSDSGLREDGVELDWEYELFVENPGIPPSARTRDNVSGVCGRTVDRKLKLQRTYASFQRHAGQEKPQYGDEMQPEFTNLSKTSSTLRRTRSPTSFQPTYNSHQLKTRNFCSARSSIPSKFATSSSSHRLMSSPEVGKFGRNRDNKDGSNDDSSRIFSSRHSCIMDWMYLIRPIIESCIEVSNVRSTVE